MSYCTPLILSENTLGILGKAVPNIIENLSRKISFICGIGGPLKKGKSAFKGYLRYKTTSQNVPSETQVKNLFIS